MRQHLLIGLVFAATVLNYVDRQALALLKPMLHQEFGWTDLQFAHLGAAFQMATAAALFLVGWCIDRFGVRHTYGAAVALWSAAAMAHAAALGIRAFAAARVVLAIAEAANTPAAMKAVAIYLPLRARSMAVGIVNSASNIGAMLAPLLIIPLALALGWRMAFVAIGAVGFLWLPCWLATTRHLVPAGHALGTPQGERPSFDLRRTLGDRRSWTVIGAKVLTDGVWWFVLFWMPDFFMRHFTLAQDALGGPLAIVFMLAALGSLSGGKLFPWLLGRGFSIDKARKGTMLFHALLILPMPLALGMTSPWMAACVVGLGLFAHQGFSTSIFGMATDIVPAARLATVIAMGAVAGNLSGAAVVELAGWSLQRGFGYAPLFVFCAGAYLATLAYIQLMQPVLVENR